MRKKLAVILAATLALQSFTVPAFAGEQYDEVVEVIEDAEGLEAAEDISDDEDIDIDYGEDTAETFDETAVDVAAQDAEWEDNGGDIVEETVEEPIELGLSEGETYTDHKVLIKDLLDEQGNITEVGTALGVQEKKTDNVGTYVVVQTNGVSSNYYVNTVWNYANGVLTATYARVSYREVTKADTSAVPPKYYENVAFENIDVTIANPTITLAQNRTGSISEPFSHGTDNFASGVVNTMISGSFTPAIDPPSGKNVVDPISETMTLYKAMSATEREKVAKRDNGYIIKTAPSCTDKGTRDLVTFWLANNGNLSSGQPADPNSVVAYKVTATDQEGTAYGHNWTAGTKIVATGLVNTQFVQQESYLQDNIDGTKPVRLVYTDGYSGWNPYNTPTDDYYRQVDCDISSKPTSLSDCYSTADANNVKLVNGTPTLIDDTKGGYYYEIIPQTCARGDAVAYDLYKKYIEVVDYTGATVKTVTNIKGYLTQNKTTKEWSYVAIANPRNATTAVVPSGTILETALPTDPSLFVLYDCTKPGNYVIERKKVLPNGSKPGSYLTDPIEVAAHHTNIVAVFMDDEKKLIEKATTYSAPNIAYSNRGNANVKYESNTLLLPTATRNNATFDNISWVPASEQSKIEVTSKTCYTGLKYYFATTCCENITNPTKWTWSAEQAAPASTIHELTPNQKSLKKLIADGLELNLGTVANIGSANPASKDDYNKNYWYGVTGNGGTVTPTTLNLTNYNIKLANDNSTCKADGTVDVQIICELCGEVIETVPVKVLKHKTKESTLPVETVLKKSTCEEEGLVEKATVCEICGEKITTTTAPVARLAHEALDDPEITLTSEKIVIAGDNTYDRALIMNAFKNKTALTDGKWTSVTVNGIITNYFDNVDIATFFRGGYNFDGSVDPKCKNCGQLMVKKTNDSINVTNIENYQKNLTWTAYVDDLKEDDELGNAGTITIRLVATYTDDKKVAHTVEKSQTASYYKDYVSYLASFDTEKVRDVVKAIDALPTADKVTLADAAKVAEAKSAYDALTSAQKALIPNEGEKLTAVTAQVEKLAEEQKDAITKELAAAEKAAADAAAGSEAQKKALEELDKAIAAAKAAGVDTTAAEKTLKDQQSAYDKAATAIAAAEKAAAAAQANPTAENIKAAEDAIAAAKAAGASDADLKKAADAKAAADTAKKAADDKKIADAVKAAEAAANAAKANPTAATVKAAEDAIAAAKKAGATDAQLANAKAATDAAKKAAEPKDATFTVSKTTVKKGKKATIKITSDAGTKITVTAANKKAKNKKSVKIKSGTTAKLTFKKAAKKGTYKFKVSTAAVGNFKATSKTIKIKVK